MDRPPMSVVTDAEHGGRWSSLRGRNGREWLWRRDAPERDGVHPGDPFVDAGGLEECVPTIGGVPDHGDAWCRPWTSVDGGLSVCGQGYRLQRHIDIGDRGVVVRYRLDAEPGWRFIWAAHTLIDVSTAARLMVPRARAIWVNEGSETTSTQWPTYQERDISLLGEADGTALMIIVPELSTVTVVDGDESLTMVLQIDGQPSAVAIWRNLRGWPEREPYRSIGIEPMLGHSPTLSLAEPGEAAVVPPSGTVQWSLTIDA